MLVNKPLNWTSFDAVNKIRWNLKRYTKTKRFKVGHAGTLDPLATGLLLICTGKFTKKINQFMGLPKSYRATIKLGKETPSFDGETEVSKTHDISHLSITDVEQALKSFIGEVEQYPPVHSAVRKGGKRLYEYARAGKEVTVDPRQVHISRLELVENKWPEIVVDVDCSKGTYIRSLAHDIGQSLGVGSYLTGLVRTKVGEFTLEQAVEVEDIVNEIRSEELP